MTRATFVNFFYWSYQVLFTDVVIIPRWAIQAPGNLVSIQISNWVLTTKQSKKNKFIFKQQNPFSYAQNAGFALNISKYSCGGMPPNFPRKKFLASWASTERRNLEGKVNILFHFTLGKWLEKEFFMPCFV
jgi:hypothetical protein